MSTRRTNLVQGMVNFPVDKMESSREGGMYVQLWIYDSYATENSIALCSGVEFTSSSGEVFIGSDITKQRQRENDSLINDLWGREAQDKCSIAFAYDEEVRLRKNIINQFFVDTVYSEKTIPLLANIVMGSTGWSNFEFICEYADLNDDGKALYGLLKKQYPTAVFSLMTFLDT